MSCIATVEEHQPRGDQVLALLAVKFGFKFAFYSFNHLFEKKIEDDQGLTKIGKKNETYEMNTEFKQNLSDLELEGRERKFFKCSKLVIIEGVHTIPQAGVVRLAQNSDSHHCYVTSDRFWCRSLIRLTIQDGVYEIC